MATVTYDGRSFMLDGRRVWIVSGSVHMGRVPREQWADRVHAAKLAGCNTIETPIFWSRCEPRPGQFDFDGDNDIRRFVQIVGDAGLMCILRPGPYVGQGWDAGGIPTWLADNHNVRLRANDPAFLEAASRYITVLADQIRDLQVTAPGAGGPIVLVQNEHEWSCGHDDVAEAYLGEIQRYLREAGLTVPTINSNQLWQGVEGQVDCWAGDRDMLAMLRQLGHVRPDQPRLVIDFGRPAPPRFGEAAPTAPDPLLWQRRLAEVFAAGGQVNISPFASGLTPGFFGGRLHDGAFRALGATQDLHAPLTDAGAPGPLYGPMRRLCHFVSRFSRVFGSLDLDDARVTLDPSVSDAAGDGAAVVHLSGSQGAVVFVFSNASRRKSTETARLMLPNGTRLDVPLGDQHVVWCLLDAHLHGRATLDFCSLCAFDVTPELLVCYGPPNSVGALSINGTPLEVQVPKGRKPVVEQIEGVRVVVVSEEVIDETFVVDGAVYVGVESVTASGKPVPAAKPGVCVKTTGEVVNIAAAKPGEPGKITLSPWAAASTAEHVGGTSPRFAVIDGPAELGALGSMLGYGWYRVTVKSAAAKRVHLAAPESADRLALYMDGEPVGVLGEGPGAASELTVPMKKGAHALVFLAENAGRLSDGSRLADPKGLYGPLYEVAAVKLAKPAAVQGDPLDVMSLVAPPILNCRRGEQTLPLRIRWTFAHRKKTPLFLSVGPSPSRGVLLLNGKALGFLEHGSAWRGRLAEDVLSRGNNVLEVAPMPGDAGVRDEGRRAEDAPADPAALAASLAACVRLTEGVAEASAKSEWAFAKWEPPPPSTYKASGKGGRAAAAAPVPAPLTPLWWRASFEAAVDPHGRALRLDLSGLTKGQVYLNGRHVGRYFVATAAGEPVPPLSTMTLPACWVREGANELLVFDEHGGNPAKVKLTRDAGPAPIRA